MKRILLHLLALAMSGCLNRPNPITLPDGTAGYTVSRCRYLDSCMNKARQLCGGDYEIKSQSESFNNGFTILVSCKAK
jgi:hypothetical protein